mgnify:CR=1 FL=1
MNKKIIDLDSLKKMFKSSDKGTLPMLAIVAESNMSELKDDSVRFAGCGFLGCMGNCYGDCTGCCRAGCGQNMKYGD